MALIVAVLGSVFGAVVGVTATMFFGASLLAGFALYFTVTTGLLCTCAISVAVQNRDVPVVGSAFEEMLDEAWVQAEVDTSAPLTEDEAVFQAQLDAPLSDMERAIGTDRDSA